MWKPPLTVDEDSGKAVRLLNVTRLHNFFDIDHWSSDSEAENSTKVCHHSDHQGGDEHGPLMSCTDCDQSLHAEHNNGHLRMDLVNTSISCNLKRKVSTCSLPNMAEGGYRSDDEEEKSSIDGATGQDPDECDLTALQYAIDKVIEKKNGSCKLKRKKVLKGRRHHTDQRAHRVPDWLHEQEDEEDHRRSLSDCGFETYQPVSHNVNFADDTSVIPSRLNPDISQHSLLQQHPVNSYSLAKHSTSPCDSQCHLIPSSENVNNDVNNVSTGENIDTTDIKSDDDGKNLRVLDSQEALETQSGHVTVTAGYQNHFDINEDIVKGIKGHNELCSFEHVEDDGKKFTDGIVVNLENNEETIDVADAAEKILERLDQELAREEELNGEDRLEDQNYHIHQSNNTKLMEVEVVSSNRSDRMVSVESDNVIVSLGQDEVHTEKMETDSGHPGVSSSEQVDLENTDVHDETDGSKFRQASRSLPVVKSSDQSTVSHHNKEDKKRLPQKFSIGMEHFTLKFDIFEQSEIEIVAAVKGTTLREALGSLFERRGLNVDAVNIFLAASHTPLPLNIDTFPLGGNHLHVKRKDGDSPFSRGSNFKPNSTGSTKLRTLSVTKERDRLDKKLTGMYIKRDQSVAKLTSSMDAPVLQRRSSLLPPFKDRLVGEAKNEYPLVSPCQDNDLSQNTASEAHRGRRTFSEDSGSIDISPHGTLTGSGTDSQRMRSHNRAGSKLSTLFSSPFIKRGMSFDASDGDGLTPQTRWYGAEEEAWSVIAQLTVSLSRADKLEQLNDLLSGYTVQGLPAMPELLTIGQPQYDDQQFVLESHWSDVVNNTEGLSKREKDHQEAVWELLRTEVNYIKSVKVVLDLFMCCLVNLQNESLLNEIDTEKLFSNISDIIAANCNFWCEYLLPMVAKARDTREPLNPVLMRDGFSKFEEIFHPYTRYCLDHEMCLEYIKSRLRDNDLFKTFVSWAETQKACGRLKLTDLIVKPWQRLTKYSLLLNAILRKTTNEQERYHLRRMIQNVDHFVHNVNATMRQRHEQERVALIMNKIESYDPIDAPNEESVKIIQEFSSLDLNCAVPGCSPSQQRNLLLEGPLKLRDAYSKTDVYCFLLTDMFLVTKPSKRGDKLKVIKPPMRLDKIVIQELRDPASFLLIHLNEFHLVTSAYVFHGEAKHWSRHFRKAQEAYKEARQSASDQSERSMFIDYYNETDEEFSAMGMFGPPPPYPHDTLNAADTSFASSENNHRDSMLSVDRFLPSHIPRTGSNDTLLKIMVAEQRAAGGIEDYPGHRPRSATFSGNDNHKPQSPINKSSSLNDKLSKLASSSPSKKSNGTSSPNSSRKASSSKKPPPVPAKPGSKPNTPELVNYAFQTNNEHLMATLSGDKYLQDLRGKLNQRRTSRTEKRYFTADAIQELQKDKDASIHKRLSWSYGTVDINIDDRVGHLKGRVVSSDSIRSVPSSSGVSSTGSLHHREDSISSNDPQHPNYLDSDIQMMTNSPDDEFGEPSSESSENSSTGVHSDSSHSNTRTMRSTSSDNGKNNGKIGIVTSPKSNSKSLPDISQIHLSTGQVQDGIASVHIGKPEGQRRKLSHAQILRMKKQLLLNSTLEASEV